MGTLLDLLRVQPADREVLRAPGRRVTYGELDRRSDRVAAALVADGVRRGARIAFHDWNGLELFEVLFGAAKAGVEVALVNARLTEPEVARVLADARPDVLVTGVGRPTGALRTLTIEDGAYERWIDGAPDSAPDAVSRHRPDPADVAVQLYTSGTSGRPKGARFSHAALTGRALDIAAHWGMIAADVSLLSMPLSHIGGLQWSLNMMSTGGRGVVVRDTAPSALLDVLERERITTGFLVPALLDAMASLPGAAERDLAAVRAIGSGASPITPAALRRITACFPFALFQCYGMTETGGVVTQLTAAEHVPVSRALDSAGRAYPWVELRIADPVTGRSLPAGERGELWVRVDTAMHGYWERPDETAAALTPDGWLRTGDIGWLDADGFLRLNDRLSDLIITGGENVMPGEVEAVLAEHADVADVAVIGVPDARWGERVTAVVVPRGNLAPDELLRFAAERLASFKVPRGVILLDELPRNPTGKVLRRALRDQLG